MQNTYRLGKEVVGRGAIVEESAPPIGSTVCLDGIYYVVLDVVRHITMCPPWRSNIYVRMADDQSTYR